MRRRILIVDDEKNITTLLRAMLDSVSGYEVEAANSGMEGLQKARAFRPELILLDVVMPDIGGDEFADLAKKEPALRNVPIIFLTGIVTKEEVKASGGKLGGYTYLAKPVAGVPELVACIEANLPPPKG